MYRYTQTYIYLFISVYPRVVIFLNGIFYYMGLDQYGLEATSENMSQAEIKIQSGKYYAQRGHTPWGKGIRMFSAGGDS